MTGSIIIGTRGSNLALYQAGQVRKHLENAFPGLDVRVKAIKTKGDKILDVALSKIGDKGLFTKEIETALLAGEVDMAIHSLKDLPTELPGGLVLGGVLERGEYRDALVSATGKKLSRLDENDVIATSSLRRKSQLLAINPGFKIVDIRGNIQTRLKKMDRGHCTAMVMAATGLQRLEMGHRISELVQPDIIVPAVGQGAIAIQTRVGDDKTATLVKAITHQQTFQAVLGERAFLRKLEGGCQVPLGCHSTLVNNKIKLFGHVSSLDGQDVIRDGVSGDAREAEKLGYELAERFLARGAARILEKIRQKNAN